MLKAARKIEQAQTYSAYIKLTQIAWCAQSTPAYMHDLQKHFIGRINPELLEKPITNEQAAARLGGMGINVEKASA